MELDIKLAKITDLEEIVVLLNKVTLNLHQRNIMQWNYPWDKEEIHTNIMNKGTYVVLTGDKMIGTFAVKAKPSKTWIPEIDEDILYLHTLAILPEFHGKNVGEKIINFADGLSNTLGKPLYLDCWSQNEKLKNFYSSCGFKYCLDSPEEDFTISVFKLIR